MGHRIGIKITLLILSTVAVTHGVPTAKRSVVGSRAVSGTNRTTASTSASTENEPKPRIATREMARYCFDVLNATLWKRRLPSIPNFTNDAYPLFVTWSKGKSKGLRGCIGTFKPLPLREGLRDYAIQSAFKDTRFKPISTDELPELHVSISILRDFEEGLDYRDWTVGVHGIRIFFDDGYDSKTATFLPEVASERGWSKLQTIDALLKKGGYIGKITPQARQGIQLIRYQSEKISMSYDQYVRFELETASVSRRESTRLA